MKKKKVNWRIYERDDLFPQSISAYLKIMHLSKSAKYPYIVNYYGVMSFKNGHLWWARDVDMLEKSFRQWISMWQKNSQKKNQLFNLFTRHHKIYKKELSDNKKIDIKKLDNKALFQKYQRAVEVFYHFITFSEYTVDLFDDIFAKVFSEKLIEFGAKKITPVDLSHMLQPARPSQSLIYKKTLLELSFKSKVNNNLIKILAEKYSWIAMTWDGHHEISPKKLSNDLTKIKKISVAKRKAQLKKINSYSATVKRYRTELIKKYNLPVAKLNFYFDLLDNFTDFHDWRKEIQMRSNQIIFRCLKEMSKRFNVNFDDILWYFITDIKELCLNNAKIPKSVINERKKGVTFVIGKGKVKVLYGNKAMEILDRLVLKIVKAKKTNEVSGIAARKGRVIAKALVVGSAKTAIKTIKKGDVLITSMTTVDFLPAMQNAAAIVTDDGGITCHAAIVSREIGIPCVVGTKVSTQIFKTGDKVEVNADTGVVKKL